MLVAVALAVAAVVRATRGVGSQWLAVALIASSAVLLTGAAMGLVLYPWTNLLVLGFGVAGGVLLGRKVPPQAMPMLGLLTVLATLDALQIVLPGPVPGAPTAADSPAPGYAYATVMFDTPWSGTRVGIFDVLLIAALVEHARRRGLPILVRAAPGVVGLGAAEAAVFLFGPLGLPLVPFLLAGWLATDLALRAWRQVRKAGQPRRT